MTWAASANGPAAARDAGAGSDGLFCDEPRAEPTAAAEPSALGERAAAGVDPGQLRDSANSAPGPAGAAVIEPQIVEALRQIYDPEIPVNVYDLGLIYGIELLPLGRVAVRMTLTSPACPVAGALPAEVEACVRRVPGVADAAVEVVWEPPWTIEMMSEDARLELNLF